MLYGCEANLLDLNAEDVTPPELCHQHLPCVYHARFAIQMTGYLLIDGLFPQRRRIEAVALGYNMRDTDVEIRGSSLMGRHVLLGVSGGIAAVDTVRLARELRRHGADLSVIMTPSAQQVITPMAVRWACQGEVITDWDGDLTPFRVLMQF